MSDMKLSQPKAARTINTARVFGCLRTHDNLSKAEIAARTKKAKKWSPRIKGGWLERYARFVGNASTGASLKG